MRGAKTGGRVKTPANKGDFESMKTVFFNGWKCKVDRSMQYVSGGKPVIRLFDEQTGEFVATASVNLEGVELGEDETAIKDYSENTGILEALVQANVVENPHDWVNMGFVKIPICKIIKEEN
jgi:hypothetical protein